MAHEFSTDTSNYYDDARQYAETADAGSTAEAEVTITDATDDPEVFEGTIVGTKEDEMRPIGRTAIVGEVYQSGSSEPVRVKNFDAPLSREQRVTVVGGTPEEQDATVFHLVATTAEKLVDAGQDGLIVVFNFAPSPEKTHVVRSATEDYVPIPTKVTDENGIFSILEPDHMAEAIASAAAEDNPRAASAYDTTLAPVISALERTEIGSDGQPRSVPPTLVEVRDAIRHLRNIPPKLDETKSGLNFFDTAAPPQQGRLVVSLTTEQRDAVAASIPLTLQNENRGVYEGLGTWLDKVIKDPKDTDPSVMGSGAAERLDTLSNYGTPPGVTVVTVDVSDTAYGRQLAGEGALLSNAALPLIAGQTPWGRPVLAVAKNLDMAGAEPAQEFLRICRRGQTPVVASMTHLNDRTAPLAEGGAYAVLPVDPPQATVLSRLLGTTVRKELTGYSQGVSANTGSAAHKGTSMNFKTESEFAEGSGTSGSIDLSRGAGFSVNESYAIAEVPLYRAAVFSDGQPGQVVAITSSRQALGRFSVRGRNYLGAFPPPAPSPTLSVEGTIAEILDVQKAAAAAFSNSSQEPQRAIGPSASPVPQQQPTFEHPARPVVSPPPRPAWAVEKELQMRYNAEEKRTASGNRYDQWAVVRTEYEEHRRNNQTNLTWPEWRARYDHRIG